MEQSVQVGLVFPRSGQQLSVTVSAYAAERMQAQYADPAGPRVIVNILSRVTHSVTDNSAHA